RLLGVQIVGREGAGKRVDVAVCGRAGATFWEARSLLLAAQATAATGKGRRGGGPLRCRRGRSCRSP
ncbi:hypothetical protein ACWD7Y_24325, partial [Streptomyces drozdowiczii]